MLGYQDRWLRQQSSDVTLIPCPPDIEDGRSFYVLRLTDSEWTEILSALDQGAILLYPEKQEQLMLNALYAETCPMALCTYIAENCLTDETFLNALIDALNGAGALNSSSGSPYSQAGQTGLVLADLGEGCDADDRYGLCYTLVDLLHNVCTDMLQILELAANELELAEALALNIPIIGTIPNTALEVAEYMLNQVIDLYAAAYNTTSHEDLACAVFCRMDDSCQLTLQMVLDGYRDVLQVTVDPPPDPRDLGEFTLWFASLVGEYNDTIVTGLYHWLVLQVFARGSAFNKATPRILTIALSQASSLAPPEGCTCDEWYHTFDFTAESGGATDTTYGQGGWTVSSRYSDCSGAQSQGTGQYVSGSGWQTTQVSPSNSYLCRITKVLPATAQLTEIEITIAANLLSNCMTTYDADGNEINDYGFADAGSGTYVRSIPDGAVKSVDVYVGNIAFWGSGNKITKLTLRGTGDNPFA